MKKIAIYCASSTGNSPEYLKAAKTVGEWLTDQQLELVYGGAKVGLMGELADAVLNKNGRVTGVIPEHLKDREIAHPNLTELIEVENMHQRKFKMLSLADAFIALPGGPGTMEEIFEVITWSQIGLHQKPFAFYNVNHYYDALKTFLDQMQVNDFISEAHRKNIIITDSLQEMFTHFTNYKNPELKTY